MRTISTFLVVVSLVIVSFFAGLASQEKPVHAGGERACPPGAINENVNGDNSTDLGDAIFLLNYLFTGGPAPCDNRRDLEFVLGRIGYVFAFPQTPLRLARGFTRRRAGRGPSSVAAGRRDVTVISMSGDERLTPHDRRKGAKAHR